MVPMKVLAAAIGQVLGSLLRPTHASISGGAPAPAWTPAQWFLSSEQGIWLDPSDFTRYMADKGPELSQDVNFDDTSKWYKGTGWSVTGGEAVHNGAAADYMLSLFAPIPGKMYEYTIVVEQIPAGGNITIYLSGSVVGTAITAPGTYTFAARCWNTVGLFKHGFRASNATGLTSRVSSFSIKEITNYDTVTMFQGSHGETPVTAVEQPVGFIVDKRQGLELGPELMTDVGFDNGAEWIKDAGWSVSGGKAVHFDAAVSYLRTSFQPVVGQWYRYRVVTGAMSAGTFVIAYAGNSGDTYAMTLANSTYDFYLRGTGTALGFALYSGTGAGTGKTVEVLSQSVKAVSGNHAFQAAAARPVLRLDGANYYNYFDRVDDHLTVAAGGGGTTGIIVCAAIRAGGAGNARTIWSDRGTNTGYRLSVNATNQLVLSAGNGAAHTEVVGPTITAGTDYVVTGWHDGANLNVQANAGAATSAAFGTATAGTAGFTIGKDNGAATSYYSGRIYEIVYRKDDASTAGDRTTLINYMAAQAGITL